MFPRNKVKLARGPRPKYQKAPKRLAFAGWAKDYIAISTE
jgi:hypothetical protein